MARAAQTGIYKPKNPGKYRGNPTNIVYRSSWELKLMLYLDSHQDVLEWGSEEIIIHYVSPLDRKIHRYFPDFYVKKRNVDQTIEHCLIEVKPEYQTKPPQMKKGQNKASKRMIHEAATYAVNEAKWDAAVEFCKDRNWKFYIFTEKTLNIK